ncbi:conserved hypothetical protein [Alkaliphilus metalliredigens QYMF]|uniref:II family cellulose-binding protein n=1 Tax=Alkaliphilus metalliredigens (strain QYMF) TaxID=293826 RepID=A6TLC5_ALKMQ|nr:DUF2721 domain-containing protein [Alkaliphilus metalliredigens]ABR46993.1 conserved hypothetical protein [Alkaliphilus metalliredigens QYMF]
MELTLTTPALLFPAISLLMLAYTNRFIVLAQLARDLYTEYRKEPNIILSQQINNLRRRIKIIRSMQLFGALSFFFCVMSMFLIFAGTMILAHITFGLSLILLLASLGFLLAELQISINALDIQLKDFESDMSEKVK